MGALSAASSVAGQMQGRPCMRTQGTSAAGLDVAMGTGKDVSHLSTSRRDWSWQ